MTSVSDIIAVGDNAMADLLKLVNVGEDGWNDLWTEDGIVLHTRKGVEPYTVDIIRCRAILKNTNTAIVKALLTPWLPYRLQWDDLMQRCDLIKELDNGYRLVHHVTKKRFPLSARDSIRSTSACYFQCDLNVKVPSFVQKLIDKAKPKFMCDKMKALRKALTTIKVDPAHIRENVKEWKLPALN